MMRSPRKFINEYKENFMTSYTGQCLCGDISYEIAGAPAMAGAAFSTLWGVPKANIQLRGQTPTVYIDGATASGSEVERHFCGRCGSPIYSIVPGQPDMLFLKTGTLDQTEDFAPQFHVWCDSKQPWVELNDDVPQMATQG
jgi:hypothetical protein